MCLCILTFHDIQSRIRQRLRLRLRLLLRLRLRPLLRPRLRLRRRLRTVTWAYYAGHVGSLCQSPGPTMLVTWAQEAPARAQEPLTSAQRANRMLFPKEQARHTEARSRRDQGMVGSGGGSGHGQGEVGRWSGGAARMAIISKRPVTLWR